MNFGDEVDADAWRNTSVTSQGDKFELLRGRGTDFWDSKLIVGSTPTLRETSLIWREYQASDRRKYYVPCPHCGEMQVLVWGKPNEAGMQWKLAPDGYIEDVWYRCVNDCTITEDHKEEMVSAGEWRPTAKPRRPGHRGYHIWQAYSLAPKAAWPNLVQQYLDAKANPDKDQVFRNTVLGEPWDLLEGKSISMEGLAARSEPYPAECPDEAVLLTAGVDNQNGSEDQDAEGAQRARIEVSVWAWGRGEESWLLGHWILDRHDPYSPESIEELDALLTRSFAKRDGTEMRIAAAAIDMGGFNQEVKDFCRLRFKRNVWCVKGDAKKRGTRGASVWPRKASRKDGNAWYMLDTQLAKDALGRRMKIESPGPGYMHFPESVADDYFEGLTAEKLTIDKRGNRDWKPKNKKKNSGEEWDCLVYAYAALQGHKATFKPFRDLSLAADRMGIAKRDPAADEDGAEAVGPDRSAQSARREAEVAQEGGKAPSAAKQRRASGPQAPAPAPAPTPGVKQRRPRTVARSSWMSR
jgi:phage terminase large subunit GpA-like protein